MKTNFVRFRRKPCEIQSFGPVFHRTHTVLPMEAGNKVPAGIADQGNAELLYRVHHIGAKAQLVRQRVTRFVYSAVHRPAKVFDKRTVNAIVDSADPVIPVQNHFCLLHPLHPFTLPEVSPAIKVF